MPFARRLRAVVIPLSILGAAIVGALILHATRPEPTTEAVPVLGQLVQTQTVRRTSHRLDVRGSGTVIPVEEIEVEPQVSGRLERVHEELVPGGIVRRGEPLFRIEPREYQLALREAQAQLASAKVALQEARAQHEIAKSEWELFRRGMEGEEEPSPLALRLPQLEAARIGVQSASAAVDRARLALDRTSYAPPFDALVTSATADIGDHVSPGRAMARLVGLDRFWVESVIPAAHLDYIAPRQSREAEGQRGREATVRWNVGDGERTRDGHVDQILGTLEEGGRMAQVLVAVPDPYLLDSPSENPQRLLLGAFVDVVIRGRRSRPLVKLPREALTEGDRALVYRGSPEDGRLSIQPVEVVWSAPDAVYVDEGLEDGDSVVISTIPRPVDGMRLRQDKRRRAEHFRPRAPGAISQRRAQSADGNRL